jgi:signal transduction histidine kinase
VIKQARRDLVYLAPVVFTALASFTVLAVGFSISIGTLAIWVGAPLLACVLRAARMCAELERRRIRALTGRELPPAYYRQAPGTGLGRLRVLLTDPQLWRDALHSLLAMPLAAFTWAVTAMWVSSAVAFTLEPVYGWKWPSSLQWDGATARGYLPVAALSLLVGLVFLVTIPPVLRQMAAVHVVLARALLSNETAELRARTEQLTASRRAVVQAQAQTLRRVERDIHDGPQQRLVRLGIDLEAVLRRLDDDPDAARDLVEQALAQTRAALSELRAVSRGIAPPILADRGLAAALAAAVSRCPVEATLDSGLAAGERLAETVESAAYFVVSEALTNVAKHARASHCAVTVSREPGALQLRVTDDGAGGAHLGKGHGLAGLVDRLAGVDGRLELRSPAGGPTVLTARIPL